MTNSKTDLESNFTETGTDVDTETELNERRGTNSTSRQMSNENFDKSNDARDGEQIEHEDKDQKDSIKDCDTKDEKNSEIGKDIGDIKDTKENKQRSVSFNRDVHVKCFGKPRESRGTSVEQTRKEPFTHLSEQELINEANEVLAQASSVTCTADHPPDKFFSLPHRRKLREDRGRRNSDDTSPEGKTPLGRSSSDVSSKKRKERTSISTLFRRAQRNKSPVEPVVVTTKPVAVVKRSKSDVTDLKSNTTLSNQTKPIRKRSGSETEEFLKSLRNKKAQLSPIIESSPREDYFKKTPPLEVFQKQKLAQKDSTNSEDKHKEDKKINPIEKPPRYKSPENEPKPPVRTRRGKSAEKDKEQSPPIADTPKRKTDIKKTLLVDEIDTFKKDNKSIVVKDKIKDSIRKIEENVYGERDMIHSSQQPPDKPPLTRGHTVDHIVKILKEDQMSPPPRSHLISPPNGTNINQPFSYLKPSVSPDANLFVRNSPDRVPSPVNKMTDKGVVYAQVKKNDKYYGRIKDPADTKFSPSKDRFGNLSDEDEGLGYEDRYKYTNNRYDYDRNENENFKSIEGYKITDSPIRPKFREYKLTSFNDFEPTYANEYPSESHDFIDKYRGRADGMDTKKKNYEPETAKADLDFNELSHRRQVLESRLNARRFDRDRINENEPITRYLTETDPIYEAEKRMKATERYVNETARYYRHTLERDGQAESSVNEDYKYDSDKVKYNNETRSFQKVPKGELDRREFIDRLDSRYKPDPKTFPPEPEYEPPSLESNPGKLITSPIEYKEKKYKVKKHLTSSHDALQTGHKYKRDEYFGKRKGHYSSNPEIAQEREEDYANMPKYTESYHNSLKRVKNKDKYREDLRIRRHGSGDSRDYYDRSPSRFDNRLVDSGIENDFRKDSSGEIHRRHRRYESDDDVRKLSTFLDNERRHTEDNYPGEQIYANTGYLKYKEFRNNGYKKEYESRDRSADDGSRYDPKMERYEKSPSRLDDKISAKPPKAKKMSGLEKVKQLFSRDSSKKSKKEKEVVQPKTRTRVLKSPEHLAGDDSDYRRYTDPEPSDIVVRKVNYECQGDERRLRSSRENIDRYRSPEIRDSDLERKYSDYDDRYENKIQESRRYKENIQQKRYNSSERDSDRPSDVESELRKTRSRTSRPMDSPALAERYRERRRLATPSPTPSPPRRPPPATNSWFKSLDRLTRKKGKQANKIEKESTLTEDESRKVWKKPQNSPAKNLRFFGDTDQDSTVSHSTVTKSKSHPVQKTHGTLRKTISNSTNGVDEIDGTLTNKSYSLSNLHRTEKDRESPRSKYYKRNLQNISEVSNVSTEFKKPPISPYDRSRSHSSSKTLKPERRSERGSSSDVRRERGSSSDVRRGNDRGPSELRGKPEVNRDLKHRRRTPAPQSGESSNEGDSSQQSQRSVVYLHATTVGDIPDPDRVRLQHRVRSRDDVSSVNSSNLHVRTTTKSFSLFAPWTPKHQSDTQDVHYSQRSRKPRKEIKKASSTKNLNEDRPALQKNKSYSQTTLTRRPASSRLTNSNSTLYKKPQRTEHSQSTLRKSVNKDGKRSQSSEIISRDERDRVSRSVSMPKDNNKKAGWFKLTNKNKKPEVNSRVR